MRIHFLNFLPAKPVMSIGHRTIILDLFLSWWCLHCFFIPSSSTDTLFQGQQLGDSQLLRSANRAFTLQFFSPAANISTNRYLGIFFRTQVAPVWIANRDAPINDSSGILTINATDGMLNIVSTGGSVIRFATTRTWYKGYGNINSSATLQDDGNLVLRQLYGSGTVGGRVLWQSFDYPTDVFLPGMKLGFNSETGHHWLLTSWISDQAPSSGSFTLGLDRNVSTGQLVIRWHENVYWTSNMRHKDSLGNFQLVYNGLIVDFNYTSTDSEKYFTYAHSDMNTAIRLTPDGKVVTLLKGEVVVPCDLYSKDPQPGCLNYSLPKCGKGENFYSRKGRYGYNWMSSSIKEDYGNLSIIDCKAKCMQNCSCSGYASLHENGTGCQLWGQDGVEINQNFDGPERLIYFRGTNVSRAKKFRLGNEKD